MIIAVDFDGTIVEHRYPEIGRERPFAIETLKMLIADNHRLILWSVREGQLLEDAVKWCKERGIEFYAVNKDYPEERGLENNNHFSRKLKVDVFIDDRNIGGLPDWGTIYQMITYNKTYPDIMRERMGKTSADDLPKKKKWWQI
ncbi:MAG: BT0820 family HAD-type phosphatase [Prevotella sp.]